jgi:hypothetical protein
MLCGMKFLGTAAILLAALGMAVPDDASARGRSGGRGFSQSGGHVGSGHAGHAHHARPHFATRVFIAAPILAVPAFYPRPYYYAPAPVYYQPAPVYIEQYPSAPQSYWYYCAPARAYYPYVGECPGGWQRVVPHNNPPPPAG